MKLLGGAAPCTVGRWLLTLARGEGTESLRGKLTSSTKAFYETNKDELTKLSLKFVVACDPNKTVGGGKGAVSVQLSSVVGFRSGRSLYVLIRCFLFLMHAFGEHARMYQPCACV